VGLEGRRLRTLCIVTLDSRGALRELYGDIVAPVLLHRYRIPRPSRFSHVEIIKIRNQNVHDPHEIDMSMSPQRKSHA
jgi:hypothetical protein